MKRVYSTILALLFALSTVVPSHAAGAAPESEPPEVTALSDEVTNDDGQIVNVLVPATGRIFINPYGQAINSENGISREEIISSPMVIINQGEAPVKVCVSAVGSVSDLSHAVFAAEPPQADTREKEIFLYAEFTDSEDSWRRGYNGAENQLLITTRVSEEKAVLTLDEGVSGWFKLFGSTAIDPEEAWCEDDEIKVTFTFTFMLEYAADTGSELDAGPEEELPEEKFPEDESEPADDSLIDVGPEETEGPGPDVGAGKEEESGPDADSEETEGPVPNADPDETEEPERDVNPEETEGPGPDADPGKEEESGPDADSEKTEGPGSNADPEETERPVPDATNSEETERPAPDATSSEETERPVSDATSSEGTERPVPDTTSSEGTERPGPDTTNSEVTGKPASDSETAD